MYCKDSEKPLEGLAVTKLKYIEDKKLGQTHCTET